MQFNIPYPNVNIFHIVFENQFIITSTLMRIQEFYESNIAQIKDNYFTLEYLIHEYTIQNGGNFNYFTKWSGFNFPKENIKKFVNKFKGNISEKELGFINFLSDNLPEDIDDYYIIATYREEDISHELAHAYYYLNEDYRNTMDELCQDLSPVLYESIYEQLYNDGYCDMVMSDEIQAYLATSPQKELNSYMGIKISKHIVNKFRKVFKNVMAI